MFFYANHFDLTALIFFVNPKHISTAAIILNDVMSNTLDVDCSLLTAVVTAAKAAAKRRCPSWRPVRTVRHMTGRVSEPLHR